MGLVVVEAITITAHVLTSLLIKLFGGELKKTCMQYSFKYKSPLCDTANTEFVS